VAHKNHPTCVFTTKAACEKARRVAIGQCSSMLDEDRQCGHWGVDTVEERPYCGQHIASVVLTADKTRRERLRREAMNAAADAWIAEEHARQADLLAWWHENEMNRREVDGSL